MDYNMIVLDLDGTLTNRDKMITPRTKAALMKAQEAGKIVVLASGRPTAGVQPLAEELELEKYGSYILSYNGGNAGALMLDSLGAQLFSNLHQVRVEGVPEHFYTVYMAYHKKHVHSRAVTDFIDFVKAYPGNDLIGQVLPEAAGE